MRHRIFIAINLPENVKEKLVSYQNEIEELFSSVSGTGPVRWTEKENLHITLVFIGYVSDQELFEICKVTKGIAVRNQPFSVNLNKICYGPPKKMPPRMVWVEGEKSKEFTSLRDDLEKSLMNSDQVHFVSENRVFSPHITLGRIRVWQWRQIEPEERPEIEKEIALGFPVESIEIMESVLKRSGPEYVILESIELK